MNCAFLNLGSQLGVVYGLLRGPACVRLLSTLVQKWNKSLKLGAGVRREHTHYIWKFLHSINICNVTMWTLDHNEQQTFTCHSLESEIITYSTQEECHSGCNVCVKHSFLAGWFLREETFSVFIYHIEGHTYAVCDLGRDSTKIPPKKMSSIPKIVSRSSLGAASEFKRQLLLERAGEHDGTNAMGYAKLHTASIPKAEVSHPRWYS